MNCISGHSAHSGSCVTTPELSSEFTCEQVNPITDQETPEYLSRLADEGLGMTAASATACGVADAKYT